MCCSQGICPGIFGICCYPRNVTIPPPTMPPTTTPSTTSTTPSTTSSPIPTVTIPPNCICVERPLCDPNGIVTIFGEGIIIPRQYGMCPNTRRVCCKILATTTQPPPTTTTMMTTTTPGQTQLCFVCNNAIQCFTCLGTIDPRLSQILSGGDVCAMTSSLPCQINSASSVTDLLGPLKNPGTSQACYCVKSWLCSGEGNVINLDGLGIIDSRFTACSSADQVCCRLVGIDLQGLRSGSSKNLVGRSDHSTSNIICGIQNNSYAPRKYKFTIFA